MINQHRYLNTLDSKSGGATVFKDLVLKITPDLGKAVLFFPSYGDGTADLRTMHCGQVCSQTKWIAQIWIHENIYNAKIPEGSSCTEALEIIKGKYLS